MDVRSFCCVAMIALAACASGRATSETSSAPPGTKTIAVAETPRSEATVATLATDAPPKPKLDRARYPWLDDSRSPAAVDSLEARFDVPAGFRRVDLAARSFGGWLRGLPLASSSTDVRSFDGRVIRRSDDEHIAAVAAIDVSPADVQQCADSVIRLHAEWRWSEGDRAISYRAASGAAMPFSRWLRGDRVEPSGASIAWIPGAPRASNHATFRSYLDTVFGFANTVSLARDAKTAAASELRPGDFVVMPGAPGHAVLILDEAVRDDGARALLLGQGYMPAQSFHVLRPSRDGAWFVLSKDAAELNTPFWPPFPLTLLRRFD